MVNSIIDGISIKLNEIFGDEYEIYSESMEQGLREPCFFISLINPSSKQKLGTRSLREYNFDIHYFPKSKNETNREINDTLERLMDDMVYIQVSDGLIRGDDVNVEVVDNILHFFITFKVFMSKEETEYVKMEDLYLNQYTKR